MAYSNVDTTATHCMLGLCHSIETVIVNISVRETYNVSILITSIYAEMEQCTGHCGTEICWDVYIWPQCRQNSSGCRIILQRHRWREQSIWKNNKLHRADRERMVCSENKLQFHCQHVSFIGSMWWIHAGMSYRYVYKRTLVIITANRSHIIFHLYDKSSSVCNIEKLGGAWGWGYVLLFATLKNWEEPGDKATIRANKRTRQWMAEHNVTHANINAFKSRTQALHAWWIEDICHNVKAANLQML